MRNEKIVRTQIPVPWRLRLLLPLPHLASFFQVARTPRNWVRIFKSAWMHSPVRLAKTAMAPSLGSFRKMHREIGFVRQIRFAPEIGFVSQSTLALRIGFVLQNRKPGPPGTPVRSVKTPPNEAALTRNR